MSQTGRVLQALVAATFFLLSAQRSAGDLFYTSYRNGGVNRVDEDTGEILSTLAPRTGAQSGFHDFVGLATGPNGILYVSARSYDVSTNGHWGVWRIDPRNGDYLGPFSVVGPLLDIAFGPDGLLYGVVSSTRDLNQYNVGGFFKKTILRANDLGGVGSFAFLTDGSIFAVTRGDQVARYDPQTGERIGPLTDLSDLPADLGLTGAGFDGMALGPDGDVYVAYDFYSREPVLNAGVMRFDGETGSFIDFVMRDVPAQGAASGGSLGVAFGPQGDLYVGSQYADAVLRYDPATGALVGTLPLTGFVTGASHLVFLNVPEPGGVVLFCAAILFFAARRAR